MKVKGHWPSASTDEPQVLALAELLQDARIGRESDALQAVTNLAKSESGKRNDFRPTPAMLCDMAKAVRRDRHQQERNNTPVGVSTDGTWYDAGTGQIAETFVDGVSQPKRVASPESRESAVAQIKNTLSEDPVEEEKPSAREDLGGSRYTVSHADLLSTERRGGLTNTEDEYVQYRWCFEPPTGWKEQPTCGPWVNNQAQAMNAGKEWLAQANRRQK